MMAMSCSDPIPLISCAMDEEEEEEEDGGTSAKIMLTAMRVGKKKNSCKLLATAANCIPHKMNRIGEGGGRGTGHSPRPPFPTPAHLQAASR